MNGRTQSSAEPQNTFMDIVRGDARGKGTSSPSVERTRIIAPHNFGHSILEIVLAKRIHERIDLIYNPGPLRAVAHSLRFWASPML